MVISVTSMRSLYELEVDQKHKFHFRPKPKVGRKWCNTFGRNRMCHRK